MLASQRGWAFADIAEMARCARFVSGDRYVFLGYEFVHDARRVTLYEPTGAQPGILLEVAQLLYEFVYPRPDTQDVAYALERLLQQTFAEALGTAHRRPRPRGRAARATGKEDTQGSAVLHPSWYYARGVRHPEPSRTGSLRLYWDICRAGAAPLLREVTRALDACRTPFWLKVLADPQRFGRADAAVLYLPMEAWSEVQGALARAYESIACYLRSPVPMLTKPLAPGLGVAEDPGTGESFGMHRCRLIAEGLWRAGQEGFDDHAGLVHRVVERFREERIRPEAPHLGAGRRTDYDFAVESPVLPLDPPRR